jgi:hypothetical protein
MEDVSPLFRIPSCVLFAGHSDAQGLMPYAGLKGKIFSGKLPAQNCNLAIATPKLTEKNVQWFYIKQGNSSALSERKQSAQRQPNPYKKLFNKGADIIPRGFYFVELNQPEPTDYEDRIINVRTSEESRAKAQKPWTDIDLKGRVESRFLFQTALARSILPFTLLDSSLIVLPILVEPNPAGGEKIALVSSAELREKGFLNAARWFHDVEKIWDDRKTDRNRNVTAGQYLNWRNKLTNQNLNTSFLVLYNSSAQDANATIVKRDDFDLRLIVDHKAYSLATSNLSEAYYLTGVFNSSIPNQLMKDFQSRGLFGARDIHKKILDVYFPRFDKADTNHQHLAQLSDTAHQKAAEYLRANPPEGPLTPGRLGRLRTDIKVHLKAEMKEIDALVERIIA